MPHIVPTANRNKSQAVGNVGHILKSTMEYVDSQFAEMDLACKNLQVTKLIINII